MDPTKLSDILTKQYMYELTNSIKLNGVPQLVMPYQVWDWGGTQYPMGSVPWQQVAALDLVPNDPNQDPQDQGVAGTSFADNFLYFLNFLNPSSTPDPGYQKLQQNLTNANRTLFTQQQNALVAFKNFVKNTGSTEVYADWLKNEGSAYESTIAQAKTQVDTAQKAVKTYLNSLSTPLKKALDNYTKNLEQVQGQDGQLITVAPWYTDIIPYDYVNEITGDNLGGDAVNGSAFSFTVSQETEQYENKAVWGEGGFGGILDWLGIESGGTFNQLDTSSFSSQYSITFSFQDLRTIQVTPGQWYDGGIVSNYKTGPFSPGYSGYKSGKDIYYFGQGGNLARIYTNMVIGYRPTIVLNAGEEFATYFHQKLTNESTVWIGPFAFELSGGSETTAGSVEIDGATITAKSLGYWGYIVAMVSNWTAPANPPVQTPAHKAPRHKAPFPKGATPVHR